MPPCFTNKETAEEFPERVHWAVSGQRVCALVRRIKSEEECVYCTGKWLCAKQHIFNVSDSRHPLWFIYATLNKGNMKLCQCSKKLISCSQRELRIFHNCRQVQKQKFLTRRKTGSTWLSLYMNVAQMYTDSSPLISFPDSSTIVAVFGNVW